MSGTRSIAARAQAGAADRGRQRSLSLALLVIATAQLMVVLDSTIVNVALPPIQRALGFSGSGLEWVVNAYALAFGGLLLLGGRAGDILGRRRVFIAGVIVFSLASLLGGLATTQEWLLAARALQGAGGAIVAPTALSLVTTTFPEGARRNRAMGVYAAMSIGGAAMGLLAGGLLTTYASWRWVLFVNVPIGVAVALLAPRALPEAPGRPGRFDLSGVITATLGLACLVYGLSSAAMTTDGVSALGRRQGGGHARGRSRPAGGVRGHRGAQQAGAGAAADLPRPQPVGCLPRDAVPRHGHVRPLLLPDPVHGGRLGVQRAAHRGRLPAHGHHGDGHGPSRFPVGRADRYAAGSPGGVRDLGGRHVLAVTDHRAQHLRRRGCSARCC